MAVLKYKNESGQFVTLTNYSVQPITPVQTTGDSMSDIMSQKAVTDELNKKVNDSGLNEKIASAITNDNGVKDAINSQVSDAISGDNTVKEAVDEAIADAIANASAVTEAVEDVVDEKLTAYTSTEDADLRYAFKEHTHEVSAITGFDGAVAESVKTEIANNNSAITESINSVVEKYIYGEGGASQDAEVVTTDNLNTTLADYAKSSSLATVATSGDYEDLTNKPTIPTTVAELTDANDYVKDSEINTLVSNAIKTDSSVSGAVTQAVAAAISADATVKEAVEEAIAQDTTVANKFGHVLYDSTSKRINFFANSGSSDVIEFIDATDFIKDGMVSGVTVENDNLVISFNTESGQEDITLALSQIFDPNNYYTTGQTSGATEIANALDGKANSTHEHASSSITTMAGYSKPSTTSAIDTSDSLNIAIGKLEKAVEDATSGGVSSVSLTGGTDNGTLKLTVNSVETDNIAVTGLGSAAYLETGTTAGTVAAGNHTHDYSNVYQAKGDYAAAEHTHAASAITNFASAVENVVSSSTTIETRVESIVASAITDNASVSGAIETAVESNSAVTASKTVTDFYSGHNSVTSLANIPTDKRLVIATINSSSNELSLSGNTLTDGYEIHVIVKNNGSAEAAVSLPSSGGYVTVGDAIKIAASSTGEINIISDGTNLYVRGV